MTIAFIIIMTTLIVVAAVWGIVCLHRKKYLSALVMLIVIGSQAINIDSALRLLSVERIYHALR